MRRNTGPGPVSRVKIVLARVPTGPEVFSELDLVASPRQGQACVAMSTPYSTTPRTTLHRRPARGSYDRATVHAILDEALVCQLGFVVDGQPFVLPTMFARDAERVFVHGAAAGRFMGTLAEGVDACFSVTLLDGLVLARSAFHHSMNYRSVVVLARAREVTDRDEKLRAMALLIDKVSPGRSALARAPNDKELRATAILVDPARGGLGEDPRGPARRRRRRPGGARLGRGGPHRAESRRAGVGRSPMSLRANRRRCLGPSTGPRLESLDRRKVSTSRRTA